MRILRHYHRRRSSVVRRPSYGSTRTTKSVVMTLLRHFNSSHILYKPECGKVWVKTRSGPYPTAGRTSCPDARPPRGVCCTGSRVGKGTAVTVERALFSDGLRVGA